MGGVIALEHALAHPDGLSALVLSAPRCARRLPPWWKLALANVARMATPTAGFPERPRRGRHLAAIRKWCVRTGRTPLVHESAQPAAPTSRSPSVAGVPPRHPCLKVPTVMYQHGGSASWIQGALEPRPQHRTNLRFVTLKDTFHEVFNDTGRESTLRDLSPARRSPCGVR
jgi:alpha-beta hydrolase superfamily lysophospholipase